MLNEETADTAISVTEADFSKYEDYRDFWMERIEAFDEEPELTWYNPGDPLLIYTEPGDRPHGVRTVLVPVSGARLTINGVEAVGRPWPT